MRGVLNLIIACLLFSCIPSTAQANYFNNKQDIFTLSLGKKNSKNSNIRNNQESLDFSGTGRPGQQTAGESRGTCSNTGDTLKGVMPTSHSGQTVAGYPSFWVYLPNVSQEVSHVEFILQNESRQDIWRSRNELAANSEYQNFSLPKTESPLEIGGWYRWYVKIYCGNEVASSQYVQGWVNRVSLTSKLHLELQQDSQKSHRVYGNYGIWYDAVDRLLRQYQRNPNSLCLEKDWQNLLEAKGVELDDLPEVGASYEAVK